MQARGRTAWNRFTPFNILVHMEATMVLVYIEGLEEKLRRRLCSRDKLSSSWSCFEERSMTEVRVGS